MAIFVVYLITYDKSGQRGTPNIGAITPLIWQQVLLATAPLTATIPCLKGFLGELKTLDLVTITEITYGYGSGGSHGSKTRSANRSFALSSFDRKHGTKAKELAPGEFPIRQETGEFSATAYADANPEDVHGSMRSFGSDQMIIQRKVEWEIERNPVTMLHKNGVIHMSTLLFCTHPWFGNMSARFRQPVKNTIIQSPQILGLAPTADRHP